MRHTRDEVSPPMLLAASLRLPEKYCCRTLKLTFFSAVLRFFSICLLDPGAYNAYKQSFPQLHSSGEEPAAKVYNIAT